jgi:hypothetical protein
MKIDVEAYSGYKADDRPLRFRLGDQWLEVVDVTDRWYDPNAVYFRVRANDGAMYVLKHDEPANEWTLAAFRNDRAI